MKDVDYLKEIFGMTDEPKKPDETMDIEDLIANMRYNAKFVKGQKDEGYKSDGK